MTSESAELHSSLLTLLLYASVPPFKYCKTIIDETVYLRQKNTRCFACSSRHGFYEPLSP